MDITRPFRPRTRDLQPSVVPWCSIFVVLSALVCFSAVATAQVPNASSPAAGACVPQELIDRSDLVLLGMYGGSGTYTPYVLPRTREAAEVVAVAGRLSRPTFLVLAAYDSTIWDLSGLTGQPVTGIYVSSFRGQGVTGVGPDVPIVFRRSQADNRPDPASAHSPCPDLRWPYSRPKAMSAAIRIFRAFGKWPSEYYGSYHPFSFTIGEGPVPTYERIPGPAVVRGEGPLVLGDADVQRNFAE